MITNSYVHIFESIPIGVVVTDRYGYILTMNNYAKSILNITDRSFIKENFLTLLGVQDSLPIENIFHTWHSGKTDSIKITHKEKILELSGGPFNGRKGALLGSVITLRDITEIENNQSLERNKEKYTIMGELSADMAHEIRNPLGSIELLASLLKKESKRKKDINRANQIIAAVKTMENKVSQLIHLSKTKQIPVKNVNIHDVLKEILLFSEKIVDGGTVILSAQYADIEPVIECNPDMIKQVFLNLILNVLQETSRLDIITHHLEERQMIEISFIEKSESTPEKMRSDILNRLSRTKEKNWGLGLAIVHNIVNMYKGYIRVEYLIHVGTAFVLSFPLVRGGISELDKINDPIENMKGEHEEK
jgi:PAS domain S-box-containing protein